MLAKEYEKKGFTLKEIRIAYLIEKQSALYKASNPDATLDSIHSITAYNVNQENYLSQQINSVITVKNVLAENTQNIYHRNVENHREDLWHLIYVLN